MSICCEQKKIRLSGEIQVPGDKSITHRAVMFGAVAEGDSIVTTSTLGRDNFATIRIMRQLGVEISGAVNGALLPIAHEEKLTDFVDSGDESCVIRVFGKGFSSLRAPDGVLDCGNSGTTARLLTGLLSGRPFACELTGDHSLVKRPFRRVMDPLSKMGATFSQEKMPFVITGGGLRGIHFDSPQASAQVKSAILLAGLQSTGEVSVTEPRLSRDHTERMLSAMGCELRSEKLANSAWKITLPDTPNRGKLRGQQISIPGDFSAAAFFLVAGSIFPQSDILLRGVGFNPTRIGLYRILERMGANIEILNRRVVGGEDVVDLRVRTAQLHGVDVNEEDVVLGIDEIPVLCMASAVAQGTTRIRGAHELRVKESDRLKMTAEILSSFGVTVAEYEDGLDVIGQLDFCERASQLNTRGAGWRMSGDHRIAMSGAILDLLATGNYELSDKAAVETSFPNFTECFQHLMS